MAWTIPSGGDDQRIEAETGTTNSGKCRIARVNANGSAQLTLGGSRRIVRGIKIRRDREHLLLICYVKWLDTLRTELHESMTPVSLDPYRAGASICQVLPRLSFSRINKSSIRYAFVTEKA